MPAPVFFSSCAGETICSNDLQADDVAKIRYAREALVSDDAIFEKHIELDTDLLDAIAWVGKRTCVQAA